jgi:hypothetical protein
MSDARRGCARFPPIRAARQFVDRRRFSLMVAPVTDRFGMPQGHRAAIAAGAALALFAAPARADTGTVVMRAGGCTHYVVGLPAGGFVLMKWFGGADPAPGEQVSGALQTYGMTTVRVGPSGLPGSAWVEDFMLSNDAAARKMFERCSLGGR